MPPDNPDNFEVARFGNSDQASRNLGIGAFNTIQSLGFSFTNPSKRRTAVVGLMFNIEAVFASIDGGTTKSPWARARTF
jgi:hypothetical protein